MEYSKTVNLPKTDFSMKANLPQREPLMLEFWSKSGIYQKMTSKNSDKKKFILHDGPPYANGNIHLGTALNKILKDIVIKYKLMSGFSAPYIPGWDCHGLPIEYRLMKELGKTKATIDKIEFREKAALFALKYMGVQREEFMRLGCFGDWENPYLTLKNEYEGTIISVFRNLLKKGYIYRKLKPVYWCATCETALADAEVEYADHTSPSIYVKFPVIKLTEKLSQVKASSSLYAVIWTTTPWTLPANVALAFQPSIEYVFIETGSGTYIVAAARMEQFVKHLNIQDFKVVFKARGADFEGLVCRNPVVERESVGILADFVSIEEGTGIVHIAPGHGEDDYIAGTKYKLPVISPVDDRGRFTGDVPLFEGQKVFAANENIINYLKEKELLLSVFNISHSYPHCWRCKKPIIFRATKQWFLSVENNNLRKNLLDSIETVKWVPDYGKNRIKGMLESRPDWCLTRQRYWGTPLPIIFCPDCDEPILDDRVLENIEKIVFSSGTNGYLKTPVSEIISAGIKCSKCGKSEFKKSEDILDVWFDSGVSSFAVVDAKKELSFPADLYLEGSDQHRGWFQTSLIPAVALKGVPPYKTVLTHGFVVDGEGKKMSKSLGNVISPQDIIKKYGAEILRLWVASENYQEDIRLSNEIVAHLVDAYRKIRNTFRFILGNINDFDSSKAVEYPELLDIDKWILSRFNRLLAETEKSYDNYEFHKVFHMVYNFCVVEISSFYFDILKDRLYTFGKNSRERLSAQTVLEHIFVKLTALLAPVLSFTAEEAYNAYKKDKSSEKNLPDSVFMLDMPKIDTSFVNEDIEKKFDAIIDIREFVLKLLEEERKKGVIGNSLEAKLTIYAKSEEKRRFLKDNLANIISVCMVSQIVLADSPCCGIADGTGDTEFLVSHATGKKCARCWMWAEDVGRIPEHPEICSKCVKNLSL